MKSHVTVLRNNQPDRGVGSASTLLALPGLCPPLPASRCARHRFCLRPHGHPHYMIPGTQDQRSPGQGGLKTRKGSKAAGGHPALHPAVSCMGPEVQELQPGLILYDGEVSWLRFNCESSYSLCVQRTQNIFPFSFCHLNLLCLQTEVPPRTFACLGKGSSNAPDGVSDSGRGLGGTGRLCPPAQPGCRPQSWRASQGGPSGGEAVFREVGQPPRAIRDSAG